MPYRGASSSTAGIPLGAVVAWLKNLAGTPALPAEFVECNGQVLSNPASVYNGATIPNLNASGGGSKRFLRGSTTSGTTGGADTFTPAGTIAATGTTVSVSAGTGASVSLPTAGHTHTFTGTSGASLPSYYEVVWIMRIK